eukprot:9104855-Pyramimonas_sp.AAC.1
MSSMRRWCIGDAQRSFGPSASVPAERPPLGERRLGPSLGAGGEKGRPEARARGAHNCVGYGRRLRAARRARRLGVSRGGGQGM